MKSLVETPLVYDSQLSKEVGGEVFLKLENKQITGSYKVRGALNALKELSPKRVVASSTGNFAKGLSFGAKEMGIPATIFMPENTLAGKVQGVRDLGAEVVLIGSSVEDAGIKAQEYAIKESAMYIHPFDNPHAIRGQGQVAKECLKLSGLEAMVVPVGGGSLAAGCSMFLPRNVKLYGVEPLGAASYTLAMQMGISSSLNEMNTIADGCRVRQVGSTAFNQLSKRMHCITVSDEELKHAYNYLHEQGIKAEYAGALSVAGLKHLNLQGKRCAVVISGGNYE